MKFHSIHIQNINSLYGEHTIQMDDQLGGADLFLILGATGAGKSTILDAICLALFGQTPRLPRSSGQAASKADQYAHNVMSYGTGECRAELVFSKLLPDGTRERFRATWYCRRARSKPGGNIQTPMRGIHRVHDDGTEDELADSDQKKYYEEHFDDALQGMTVDDFMRCIMLAQGQFTAFLRASENEKASILERLTRTDEYKTIGARASLRRQEIARDLKDLEDKLDGLEILPADALAEVELERTSRTDSITSVTLTRDAAQAASAFLERVDELSRRAVESRATLDSALAKLESSADTLARAADHRRVEPAVAPLARARSARAALWDAHSERVALSDALADARPSRDAAAAALASATESLAQARAALEQRRDAIEAAVALDASVAERQERLTSLTAELTAATTHLEVSTTKRDDALATLIAADEHAERARAALEALAPEAELIEGADAIEEQITSIELRASKCSTLTAQRDEVSARAEALSLDLQTQRDALAPLTTRREELAAELELARSRVQATLEDAESASVLRRQVTERVEETDTRLDALEKAKRAREDLLENARVIEDAQSLEHAQVDAIAALEEQRDARTSELAGFERQRIAEHAKRDMLREMLAYSDARDRLVEGDPCPVCGSVEHPAHANDGDSALRERLERVEAALARVDEREREVRVASLSLEKSLATAQRTRESAATTQHDGAERRAKIVSLYDGHRHRAGLDAVDSFPPSPELREALRAEEIALRASLKLERQRLRDTLDELGAAREALNLAQRAHDAADAEIQRASSKIALGDERLARHLAEHETLLERITELDKSLVQDRLALHTKLTERGVPAGSPDAPDLRGALERLRADRARLTAARAAVEETSAAQETARASVETTRADARSAQERVDSLSTSRASLTDEVTTLRARRLEALDHDDPKGLRAELEATITRGDALVTSTRESATTRDADVARLEARLEERQASTAARADELAAAQAELESALGQVQITDENALDALVIPEPERAELLAQADAITTSTKTARAELTRLETQREELTAAPPEVDGLHDRDLDAWRAARALAETELAEHHAELGKIEQTLERHRKACEDSRELATRLNDMRATYATWKTIANLIGRNDGDSFKTFAQSLNLQELVDRANLRLAKLSPRYLLAVARGEQNEPRLDFVVRDRHQANAERPLTTLSGGETFLVSLALALGLSDLHRVDLPIETLLLDEGFGTLDQETLDSAMTTLRNLQHDVSRQIGIISHVEGLKERVPARIHVDKLGNGRSTLRVEIDGLER